MKNFRLTQGSTHNDPKQIIVHAMGEYIKTPHKVYIAAEYLAFLGYSAHILVSPDGELTRCREDKEGAYHALGFNTDTLGVEILVPGVHDYSTFLEAMKTNWCHKEQLEAAAGLCSYWTGKYGIGSILRHSDISPDRKVDPGTGFPWETFLTTINIKLRQVQHERT